MVAGAYSHSEAAHVLIIPVAILLLAYHRRDALREHVGAGSVWGTVFVVIGIILFSFAYWPFNYGYVRNLMILPVLAGVILVACGGSVLKRSLPMLLLVLLAIPVSSRLWAALIIRPETYTIAVTAATLDKLPGVDIQIEGVDIFYSSANGSGCVALGESNRGARLLLAFLAVGVFVVFSRIRPMWRVITAAVLAMPIVLFCNFFRLLCWAVVVVYTGAAPESGLGRNVSLVCSLFASYGLFAIVCSARPNLFIEEIGTGDDDADIADGAGP